MKVQQRVQGDYQFFSNLLERNTLGGVYPRIELGNRLKVVVPTCLFSCQTTHLERLKAFLTSLESTSSDRIVHAEGSVSLGKFHRINLCAQERYIGATITRGTLDLLSDLMTVTPIFLEKEWRRIPASLEVSRRGIQSATAFVHRRLHRFESN